MAARIFSLFVIRKYSLICLCLLCCLEKGFSSQGKEALQTHTSQHTCTVQLSSLLPSLTCNPSSTGLNKSSLKVVHKYGPCSHLHRDHVNTADLGEQILRQDQFRVKSLRSRLFPKQSRGGGDTRIQQEAATTLPAKPGSLLGTANYFVTVGLGTPQKDLSLAFDTGSDLTWTQCAPCAVHCYDQAQDIFDPSASSSYDNATCSSEYCSTFKSGPGKAPECYDATCIYTVKYGDKSYTEGFLAKETLTLTPSDVITDFLFGCGQNNGGLFHGTAGLLGLGRGKTSIVEQAAQKYNGLFSYCLPNTSSSTGKLTFGGASESNAAVQYTPMLSVSPGASFYGIQLSAITIAGVQLEVPVSSRTIIDSGTVITRLPPGVYSALRSEFRKQMAQYPPAPPSQSGLLDTCYDFSAAAQGSITYPKISLSFGGGVTVDLLLGNIMFGTSVSHVCLAFAGDGGDLTILGNVQQKGFEVVYDLGGAKIGFSPGGC